MPIIPFIPLIATAATGGIGGALQNTKSARTGTSSETGTSTSVSSATDSPENSAFMDMMRGIFTKRLMPGGSSLPAGFVEEGISGINRNADLSQQSLENRLSGRGLLGSGGYGAGTTDIESRRFGDINNLELVQAPRMEREFQDRDLSGAMNLYGLQRPTVTTTGSQTGTGTQTAPGSALGSGLTGSAQLMAYLLGKGVLGGGGKGTGSAPLPFMGNFAF